MKSMLKRLVSVSLVLIMLALVLPAAAPTAKADDGRVPTCLFGFLDANGEIKGYAKAYPMRAGEAVWFFVPSYAVPAEQTCYTFLFAKDEEILQFPLEKLADIDGITLFESTEFPMDYTNQIEEVSDETYIAEYLPVKGEGVNHTAVTLEPISNDENGYGFIRYRIHPEEPIGEFLPSMVILSEENNVVAFAVSADEAFGISAQSGSEPPAPTEGQGETTPPTGGRGDTGDTDDSGWFDDIVTYVIGIGIIAAIALLLRFVVFRKKTKAEPAIPVKEVEPLPTSDALAPEIPDDAFQDWQKAEPIAPVAEAPKQQSRRMCAVWKSGPLVGQKYPLTMDTTLIGRNPDAQIRFPADTKGVSRQHCELIWSKGELYLMDLGSSSGTVVSGKGKIPANKPVKVSEGDHIYLGSRNNEMVLVME